MTAPRLPDPQLLVIAAFSRHRDALGRARHWLEREFGPVALAGQPYRFDQTAYYEPTMGQDLEKQLCAMERLVPPDQLADIKQRTIDYERLEAASGRFAEPRPINLDPGLLSLGKFVLATTKDQAHRLYLRDGIFAEVTLRFQEGTYHPCPWTYADYRLPEVTEFLRDVREVYKQRLARIAR